MKTLNHTNVQFGNSLNCVSSAAKFTIRVPALLNGGEPMVFPEWHEKAGQAIVDYEGKPIADAGIVFWNPTDKKVQAGLGDGNGIIIINQVDEAGADALAKKLTEITGDPDTLTLEQIKEWLASAYQAGFNDIYCSDVKFHAKNFTPLGVRHSDKPFIGRFKRDARDVCQAVYVAGEVEFADAKGSPGQFADGVVILKHGDNVRAIRPDKFLETYRNLAGTEISLDEIPVFEC